jgi:hypothetical protein
VTLRGVHHTYHAPPLDALLEPHTMTPRGCLRGEPRSDGDVVTTPASVCTDRLQEPCSEEPELLRDGM